jgi:beta-galactosidase
VQGIDLMGVNYNFKSQDRWDQDPRYANKPTLGSETSSCVSSRGEYFFPGTKHADWQVSSYDLDHPGWGCTPDAQFRINARWPHLLGEFVWTGFDYLGEPTPFSSGDSTQLLNFRNDPTKRAQLEREMAELAKKSPPSRSSYFGIIDLAGFPKDRYYIYQAQWRPDFPMAHLLPHWNWPDRIGEVTPVHVYTSGDEAELFLNGKSLGRKTRKPGVDFRLVWDDVEYQPGELKVVAYKQGKEWASDTVKTTGPAAKLALGADRATIKADGRDLSFITVRIADQHDLTVPRSHQLVKFGIEGPGEIVAVDNGDPTSFEPFQATQHKAFNGLALVIVRAKPGATGAFTVKATAEHLSPATVVITCE